MGLHTSAHMRMCGCVYVLIRTYTVMHTHIYACPHIRTYIEGNMAQLKRLTKQYKQGRDRWFKASRLSQQLVNG